MSDQAAWNPEIVELAREFHEIYEREAKRLGWSSQTPVPFDELPLANLQTMLCTIAPFWATLSSAERDRDTARAALEEARKLNSDNADWLRRICADLRLSGDVLLAFHDPANPDAEPDWRDSGLSLADELWLVANALDGSVDASRQGIRARFVELETEIESLKASPVTQWTREKIDAVIDGLEHVHTVGTQRWGMLDELRDALLLAQEGEKK
ncbi:MAG TPA: hypothetical protein VG246_13075 [Acidimicrobiales bacterium]|jgi:hypothetical protein|nr:hypothetical protein [Acidimicrobiales bacterium]